jgi:large subunit ribosomal protein L32
VTTSLPDGSFSAAPPAHLWAHAPPLLARGVVETHALLEQPLDGWLCMAVPKRKVTPSRKGIRNQGKHLRFQSVVPKCPGCGKVRLQHGVCPFCLGRGGGLPIGQAGVQDTQDGPPPP